jgi:hypothetical protein
MPGRVGQAVAGKIGREHRVGARQPGIECCQVRRVPRKPWMRSTTGAVPALVEEIAPPFSGILCSTTEAVEGFRPIAPRAVACRVAARLGPVCIVIFQEESTELPGCELSLSRCRRRGGVFRAGWTVNQA